MSKVKYYYDPDTLSYRKIEPDKKKKSKKLLLIFVTSFLILFIGSMGGYYIKSFSVLDDVQFSKFKLLKISEALKIASAALEKSQTLLIRNSEFLEIQEHSIRYNEQMAVRRLEKITKSGYKLVLKNQRVRNEIDSLISYREAVDISNEIPTDKLIARERAIKPIFNFERIALTLVGVLFGFILTRLSNYFSKKKMEIRISKKLKHDKKAFEKKIVSLKNKLKSKEKIIKRNSSQIVMTNAKLENCQEKAKSFEANFNSCSQLTSELRKENALFQGYSESRLKTIVKLRERIKYLENSGNG